MTDEELRRFLKPKQHWGAVITVAILVAGTVWAGTEFLHSRASNDDTKKLQNDVFEVKLNVAVQAGDIKAIGVRLESIDKKLDTAANEPKRRR